MTKPRVVGLLLALPLVFASLSADAAVVRGQVLSISRADCRSSRPCEGSVTLWNDGTRKTIRVISHTKITRGGEPVQFEELGVGNLATFKDYGRVKREQGATSLRPASGVQAP